MQESQDEKILTINNRIKVLGKRIKDLTKITNELTNTLIDGCYL